MSDPRDLLVEALALAESAAKRLATPCVRTEDRELVALLKRAKSSHARSQPYVRAIAAARRALALRNQVIEHYLWLAHRMAGGWAVSNGLDRDAAQQEAELALTLAVHRYDPERSKLVEPFVALTVRAWLYKLAQRQRRYRGRYLPASACPGVWERS